MDDVYAAELKDLPPAERPAAERPGAHRHGTARPPFDDEHETDDSCGAQPDLAAGQRQAAQRRYRHRHGRHPGRALRLHLQRSGVGLTSRFVVVDRETAYESAVAFTPYAADRTIDAAALGALLDDAYDAAGVRPADVDTGAVIITGEAMRR